MKPWVSLLKANLKPWVMSALLANRFKLFNNNRRTRRDIGKVRGGEERGGEREEREILY